ncbi:AAA family ATPase [Bacteroides thetaiotaomicron]|nr:AAA family ATPase [Bacteroides thetaiotaomicron]MCS3210081.1 AAA family ATPase [Bacteroides thetaiotaomicron]
MLGARGMGKTTMLLQHIKLYDDDIGNSVCNSLLSLLAEHGIFDLSMEFYQQGGKKLYIDEIHKYTGWSREIKNIYDLIPGLKVVYIGSSILDLETGEADLSRLKIRVSLNRAFIPRMPCYLKRVPFTGLFFGGCFKEIKVDFLIILNVLSSYLKNIFNKDIILF